MQIHVEVLGYPLVFTTKEGLFSPQHPDRGTMAMLCLANFQPGMKVLDLGCGWGLVGVAAAQKCGAQNVMMCDRDPVAVETARENALANGVGDVRCVVSDGLTGVDETGFDLILSNPPYQSDFSVAKHFLEKGFNRLKLGGSFLMVTKRKEWYKKKFISLFGGVTIQELDGYFVFQAEKRSWHYASVRS